MLKIFQNKNFLFQKLCKQTWQKYYIFTISFKQNKERLLLLIPENMGITYVFNVHKTKMLTEYREKGIRCFKN